jgi:hypothetical protein
MARRHRRRRRRHCRAAGSSTPPSSSPAPPPSAEPYRRTVVRRRHRRTDCHTLAWLFLIFPTTISPITSPGKRSRGRSWCPEADDSLLFFLASRVVLRPSDDLMENRLSHRARAKNLSSKNELHVDLIVCLISMSCFL